MFTAVGHKSQHWPSGLCTSNYIGTGSVSQWHSALSFSKTNDGAKKRLNFLFVGGAMRGRTEKGSPKGWYS